MSGADTPQQPLVDQLDDDQVEVLAERVLEKMEAENADVPRRELLKAGGVLGLGGLLGGGAVTAATGVAEADASTSDSDGDVGTPSDRVDVFSDGVDAVSIDTEQATINSATIDSTGIAIGDSNTDADTGDSSQGIAIGNGAKATNNDTVAIGENADAGWEDAVMIGRGASATGAISTGVGDDIKVPSSGVSIGTLAGDDTATNVDISNAPQSGDIAIGRETGASGEGTGAVAIGREASVDQANTDSNPGIALGAHARTTGDGSIAIGSGATAPNDGQATIGGQVVIDAPNGQRFTGADFGNNKLTIYLDEANSNIVFKANDSSGTTQAATLSYA